MAMSSGTCALMTKSIQWLCSWVARPADLARCAALGEEWGYDEINLNCGCPSDCVQNGRFGACLMAEPPLVRDCVAAMRDSGEVPVTVKHRSALITRSATQSSWILWAQYPAVPESLLCTRKAWLQGLSPKENREIPPLNYEWV